VFQLLDFPEACDDEVQNVIDREQNARGEDFGMSAAVGLEVAS